MDLDVISEEDLLKLSKQFDSDQNQIRKRSEEYREHKNPLQLMARVDQSFLLLCSFKFIFNNFSFFLLMVTGQRIRIPSLDRGIPNPVPPSYRRGMGQGWGTPFPNGEVHLAPSCPIVIPKIRIQPLCITARSSLCIANRAIPTCSAVRQLS